MISQAPALAQEILDALAAHIAVLDATGAIVAVNGAWSRFALENGGNAGTDAYVGANYLSVCREAARRGEPTARAALDGLEAVLRGDRDECSLEYPCDAPERPRWFRMSVTRCSTGLVVAHDEITAQKESERALTESERLLRSVLASLPVGVWILDAEGRIVQGNAAGVRIWAGARYVGLAELGQYKGWWLSTGQPIAAEEWGAARAIRNGETSIDEEIEIECFDGTRKIILNSALPLRDSNGRVAGAIVVNQDITARKRAEVARQALLHEHERLRIAAQDASRIKDEFIATLSHELRTPVQSVLGWAAILKRVLLDPQACERAASAIERNARIQAQLLGDTLDISRIIRGTLALEMSDVDLAVLVRDVIESMRPAAGERDVVVVDEVCGGPAVVHGDPTRLQQIVWNLMANALKFTPPGGRVEVRARAAGDWVEVSVCDTGVGIAPEFMPFLFDRFRQGGGSPETTRHGLGLGLAIVKELVDVHHGTIAAESAGEGQGATFTVRLPAAGHPVSRAG